MTKISGIGTTETSWSNVASMEAERGDGTSVKFPPSMLPGGRGALVKKTADQTTANYSVNTAIAWNGEEYDTSSIHDNVTNNTRLTTPSGTTKVRLAFNIGISLVTAATAVYIGIYKNGSTFIGGRYIANSAISTAEFQAGGESAIVAVTGGTDYFELKLQIPADSSVTISSTLSWFAMEVIA